MLDDRKIDFEYDGEMSADVALDPEMMALYPFCRLKGPANVLIMPALHTAHISAKLLQQLGGGTVIGPLLIGLEKPIQVVPMNATVSDIINIAALAAHEAAGGRGGHRGVGRGCGEAAPPGTPPFLWGGACHKRWHPFADEMAPARVLPPHIFPESPPSRLTA